MTSHYIDIRLLLDPETSPSQLLGVLYGRLHLRLVQLRACDVGVSFPGYSASPRSLGHVLRLHGTASALASFLQDDWLRGVRDHVQTGEIAPVPGNVVHRVIRRRQFKTNAERLRRRRMRRRSETAEQAREAIPGSVERQPDLPYLHLRSSSTGQVYCVFLEMAAPQEAAVPGPFNSYGLGGVATVPWF